MKTRFALLSALVALSSCGFDDRIAGGTTSEVPNALHGAVVDSTGHPLAGVAVRLASSASWADSAPRFDTTRTDSLGRWAFRSLPDSGELTLYLRATGTGGLARLSTSGMDTSRRRDTLRELSWVEGRVVGATGAAKVALLGTDLVVQTDDQGRFSLPVPAGNLNILVAADSQGVAVRRTLALKTTPRDTGRVGNLSIVTWGAEDYSLWSSSRTATIDLTTAGAGIRGDHVGFPVPVRLDTLFDIRKVKPAEIRFDNGKGLKLPFEIETWDTLSGKAVAWVRLDTANGNSDKHSLRALWGRPGASLPSGMPAVFDASNGFLATWHLAATTESSGSNRLVWQNTTTTAGNAGPFQATTVKSAYQTDSVSLGGTRSWTVSLWVKLDAKPSGEIHLAGFRDGPSETNWGLSIRDDQVARVWSGADTSHSLESPRALPLGRWVHLAATFEAGDSPRIGLVVDSTVLDRRSVVYPAASTQRLRSGSGFAVGGLDELRLSTTDRAGSWSALESQVGTAGVAWLRWN